MKSAFQILSVCVLAVVILYPTRVDSASISSHYAAKLRHRLLGRWTLQMKGADARGVCLIDITMEFRADGRFLCTRTFHAVDHPRPTWDCLLDTGAWKLRDGVLVQHWEGNGEHPGGYTTRDAVLSVSAKRLRCFEGVDGTVSYHRTSRQVRSAVPPHLGYIRLLAL